MTNELYHHGILGQRWGIRRYQNEDGSLTSLGKKRYGDVDSKNLSSTLNKAVNDDYKNMSTMFLTEANLAKNISDYNSSIIDTRKKKAIDRIDLSELSDSEIQSMVVRMNLERNYKTLATENVGRGQSYVNDILKMGGSILGIASTAAGLALALRQLKND